MTEHAQTARACLGLAGDPRNPADALQQSLVHATLEVAEQQRAANLIAYEALALGRPDHDGRRAVLAVPRSFLTDEIDRILDIEGAAEAYEAGQR